MASYKIGQILTAKCDLELEQGLAGNKVKIPKGSQVIIGADGLAHHFHGGYLQRVKDENKAEGFDARGIAVWLRTRLAAVYDLERMLEDNDCCLKDFEDSIVEALEEIGLCSPDEEV